MTDPSQAWTSSLVGIATADPNVTKDVALFTHPLSPAYPGRSVTLIFLRLADTQLETLWSSTSDNNEPSPGFRAERLPCGTDDCYPGTAMGSDSYSRSDLIAVLVEIMGRYGATSVSTLDFTGLNYSAFTDPHKAPFTDNGSHVAVAMFALAAAQQYQSSSATSHSVFLRSYRGYSIGEEPADLSDEERDEKCRVASYYTPWETTQYGPTNPPPPDSSCAGPQAFAADVRMYSTRSLLGTGPLQGRLAIGTSTDSPTCLGVDRSHTIAISTPCAGAPSWIITTLNQIQLAGTSSCLKASPSSHQVVLARCAGAASEPARDWTTFFLLSNGQIRARERGDSETLPSLFPPNPSGSCLTAGPMGASITYGFCLKNCINETTGQQDPDCHSDNRSCCQIGNRPCTPDDQPTYDQNDDQIDGPNCSGAGAGGVASQACLPGLVGEADLHCFATSAGTPIDSQDWTLVFDAPRLVSGDFSNGTEVGSASSYYRTFAIGDKNVCVRRADGVWCASANLARGAAVVASSSYETTQWSASYATDGHVDAGGGGYGFSTLPSAKAPAYLEIHLPAVMTFDHVALYPRNDPGNLGVGFPINFKIQIWNGVRWITRVRKSRYPATGGKMQLFSWRVADTTDRIRIYATRLPSTSSGTVMQLAEVEVYNYGGYSVPSLMPSMQLTNWFADADGWGDDANGSTVRAVWDANAEQLIACGRGFDGVSCTNGLFTPAYSNSDGWATESDYYGSLRYADIDGDGAPDICGRGYYGVSCALNSGSSFSSADLWSSDFSASDGWNSAGTGDTMMYGDIDADGKTDVCGRGAFGLECSLQRAASFDRHHDWSFHADRRAPFTQAGEFGNFDQFAFPGSSAAWNTSPAYYGSIRMVDLNHDGFADVCGRSSNGTYCAFSMGNRFDRKHQVILKTEDLTDTSGWWDPSNGSTLTFGDLNGDSRVDLCARGIDGIVCTTGY
jgi:hypothetical protein